VSVQVENPAMRESKRIRTNDYTYSAGGQTFRGIAFTTGTVVIPGQSVVVEYSRGNPRWSRVEGMRRDRYSPAAALVTVVPLLGLLLVGASVRAGVRRNGVLRDGEITGRQTAKPVLHDQADPERNEILDGGVSGLSLDEHGAWRGRPVAAWLSMLLPAFVIGMNALTLWRHLR
jgi:hypothetical protein